MERTAHDLRWKSKVQRPPMRQVHAQSAILTPGPGSPQRLFERDFSSRCLLIAGMDPRLWNRRSWLNSTLVSGLALAAWPLNAWSRSPRRSFHVCLSPAIVEGDPQLLEVVREAGVNTVWLAGFFYGHRPFSDEQLRRARGLVERVGMEAHLVNVPLGHPGDSLGSTDGGFPLTPPRHWHIARRLDGSPFAGTSLHEPASEENAAALQRFRRLSFHRCFLDDDFRLARGSRRDRRLLL